MPTDYFLPKVDYLCEKVNRLGIECFMNSEEIANLKRRLEAAKSNTTEGVKAVTKPGVTVKVTCDNSAFLQSLDEIEKKIDAIQNKMNQLKKSFTQTQGL